MASTTPAAPASAPRAAEQAERAPGSAELRRALDRALRDLAKAKASKEELVAAVHQAARDACEALALPNVPPPAKQPRSRNTAETAIAPLADWQLGKRTPSYNSTVCAERIEEYGDRVLRLVEIQRAAHPVRDLRVYLLGDLVEGELIFPGQAHRIDASLFAQVLADGPTILGGFLRKMLTAFERVHVVGVVGNHGAIGGPYRRETHPETNADAMLYEVTRLRLIDEKRLTWAPNVVQGERNWYAVDRVGSKAFMLFHGDQVRGYSHLPWYGFHKKVSGWRLGAVEEPFDYALHGHFHTPNRMLVGRITVWGAGSTESGNTYAAEQLAAQGTPSQWLLFCHPEHGVTSEYQVHLGGGAEDAEAA